MAALPSDPNAITSMTLRDWFAAQALIGFLAAGQGEGGFGEIENADCAADYAYDQADAMMRRREAPPLPEADDSVEAPAP